VKRSRILILLIGIIVILAAAALTLFIITKAQHRSVQNISQIAQPSTPLVDVSTLQTFPTKSASSADVSHVGGDLIPPTNSWLSGMVLQKTPLAVYPMPLSFLAKDTGFEIGLPTVLSTPTIITGEHVPGIIANIQGATTFRLTRYDKISATLTYYNGMGPLGSLTLAEGSPYVFYHPATSTTLTLNNVTSVKSSDSSYLRYTNNGHDYVIVAGKGSSIKITGTTAIIATSRNSLVTFYALSSGSNDSLKNLAGNELAGVGTSYSSDSMHSNTIFNYKTSNNKPTVFATMSYENEINSGELLATYDSVYGPMRATEGNEFTTQVTLQQPSDELNLSKLTGAQKQIIMNNLVQDVASTSITAPDSYYSGKELARAATLLDIAEQLHQADSITKLKTILNAAFATRLSPSFFYYDSTLKGMAAITPGFGSEDFNDHDFHYGYFIYAASILGKYDENFVTKYQKQINLLVADIASYDLMTNFPIDRYYDAYAGHSWAAGLAPFPDGNNQESSSEAINAWNGVALWATLTHNPGLGSSATWMLSNEAATARSAWRSVDTNASYLKNYTSPLASLNFGGKRTYTTFFSDEPNAKLGIQLLPLSPMMLSFSSDKNISQTVNSSIKNDNFNVALGDYDLMYLALSDPSKAASLVNKQQDAFIDDGNSRTYMDAWIFSLE
jgi:endo-1,3(4)-beta-glucanase